MMFIAIIRTIDYTTNESSMIRYVSCMGGILEPNAQ